jgi:hypothetical protein
LRYEVIRMAQFLFSLALIFGAFASGLLLGWYCWGPRRSANHQGMSGADDVSGDEREWAGSTQNGRGRLFSPEGDAASSTAMESPALDLTELSPVDLRFGVSPRGELTTGDDSLNQQSVPQETLVGETP